MLSQLEQLEYSLNTNESIISQVKKQIQQLKTQVSDRTIGITAIENTVAKLAVQGREAVCEYKEEILSIFARFESEPTPKPPLIIGLSCTNSFGVALAPDTYAAQIDKKLTQAYPVSFRDNPARQPSSNALETYTEAKPTGESFLSLQDAFCYYAKSNHSHDQLFALMVEVQTAKLQQHPRLVATIKKAGGSAWIIKCEYKRPEEINFWSGKGAGSRYLMALLSAYQQVTGQKENMLKPLPPQTEEPQAVTNLLSYYPENRKLKIYFDNLIKARDWKKFLVSEQNIGTEAEVNPSNHPDWQHELILSGIDLDLLSQISNSYSDKAFSENPPRQEDKANYIKLTEWCILDTDNNVIRLYFQNKSIAELWQHRLFQDLAVGSNTEIIQSDRPSYKTVVSIGGVSLEEAKYLVGMFPEIELNEAPEPLVSA